MSNTGAKKRKTWDAYYAANRVAIIAKTKAWKAANADKIRAWHRNRHKERAADPTYRMRMLVGNIRKRCRKTGMPFDLDAAWINWAVTKTRCELTGCPFVLTWTGKKIASSPCAPSIDQIRHGEGYTKDNVRLVTVWANRARSQWGDDVFYGMCLAALRCTKDHCEIQRIRRGAGRTYPRQRSGSVTIEQKQSARPRF